MIEVKNGHVMIEGKGIELLTELALIVNAFNKSMLELGFSEEDIREDLAAALKIGISE